MNGSPALSRQELIDILQDHGFLTDLTLAAFALAEDVHGDQRRSGGGPYLEEHVYPVTANVVRYLAGQRPEDAGLTVIVSLLHDAIEDSNTLIAQHIETEFGAVIALRVAVLTKPDKRRGVSPQSSEDEEALYVSGIANADEAVRVVKVFDRLNNLAAVHQREPSRRRAYLVETRSHYVSLARSVDEALAGQMIDLLNEQESRLEQSLAD